MIRASFKFPDLAAQLAAAQQRIEQELIVALQTNRGLLFDAEGGYNGHPKWDPLMMRSGQILANRGTLRKSIAPGTRSGTPGPGGVATAADGLVTVGTAVASAALMNFGTTKMPDGVMRPVRAKALKIPIQGGAKASDQAKTLKTGKAFDQDGNRFKVGGPRSVKIKNAAGKTEHFIFRKWVRIPARPFDTITPQDADEFNAALQAVIDEVMNG